MAGVGPLTARLAKADVGVAGADLAFARPFPGKRALLLLSLLFALVLAGIWGWTSVRESGREHALWADRLLGQSLVRADRLSDRLSGLRREVLFLASVPPVGGIVRALPNAGFDAQERTSLELWMRRLRQIYSGYFALDTDALRLSLVGTTDRGREIAAFQRTSAGVSEVVASDLRQAADQPFFIRKTPVAPSTELDFVPFSGEPLLMVSTPVPGSDGTPFVFVVMQIDARSVLATLADDVPADMQVYVAYSPGDLLLHFDGHSLREEPPSERAHWQAVLDGHAPAAGLRPYVTNGGERLELVTTRVPIDSRDPGHAFTVGMAVPEPILTHRIDQARFSAVGSAAGGLLLVGGVGLWYRRQQERANLRQARLAAIVTHSADAVIAKRLDGVVVDWNPGAEAMFGYSAAEAIGRPLGQLIVLPEHAQQEADILARVARGEVVAQFEAVRHRRDGSLLDVSITVSPIRTPNGAVVGAAKTVRDITQRKRTEELLKKGRAQLATFVEHAIAGIAMFDRDMRYLAHSQSWLRLIESNGKDLLGRCHYEAHPNLPEHVRAAHRAGLAGVVSDYREDHWVDRFGAEHWERWSVMPWYDESGSIGGIIVSIEDFTDLKQGESEREKLLGELRDVNAALEQRVRVRTEELSGALKEREVLLQEMHHRVKNNLQVVSSLIRMQMRQLPAGAGHDALEDCQTRIQAIALIHERLYRTKNYASIEISEYVAEMAESVLHASGLAANTVALKLEIEPVALPIDRAIPCGLIFNELVGNALKHAFPDGRCGTVQVRVRRTGPDCVRIGVSDDGIGMPEGADTAASKSLGLQLVRTLARQINGQLQIRIGAGTHIEIEFPA